MCADDGEQTEVGLARVVLDLRPVLQRRCEEFMDSHDGKLEVRAR